MSDHELLVRIDACRPGSKDFADPGMATLADELLESHAARSLYQRVQAADKAIGEALHDTPVPEGLSERLLERLAAVQNASAMEQAAPASELAASPAAAPGSSRRRWLRWGAAVAVAASLIGVMVTLLLNHRGSITAANIAAQAESYYAQDERQGAQPLEKVPSPASFPIGPHVNRSLATQWRPVAGFLGRGINGVAYDMTFHGISATLYVVPVQVSGLPGTPPQHLEPVTGNRAVAAWQEGGLVYVLVVQGDERAYRSFVRLPPTA